MPLELSRQSRADTLWITQNSHIAVYRNTKLMQLGAVMRIATWLRNAGLPVLLCARGRGQHREHHLPAS